MKKLYLYIVMLLIGFSSLAQNIKIEGNKFTVEGKEIWFNGINTPWHLFGDFGRQDFTPSWWSSEFAKYKENNINLARVWIHCSGEFSPTITSTGEVTGADERFWSSMDHLMKVATENEVYIMPALFSFDITKNGYQTTSEWRKWIQSEQNIQSYIDNVLIPMLNRYENETCILAWEICNEPEWMFENSEHGPQSFSDVQRMHAMLAAAVHENSSKFVTTGSAAPKWNSPIYDSWGEKEGNMFSDEALSGCINNPNAFLDFYQYHWYPWQTEWLDSPFTKTTSFYEVDDRPVIVGEAEGNNVCDKFVCQTVSEMYISAYNNGFDGVCAWKTPQNDGHGTFENIAAATNNFYKLYPQLVYPIDFVPVAVTGVDIASASVSVMANKDIQLKTTVSPSKASDKSVVYTSSDETVATVDDAGMVSGIAEGTTIITVTTNDGSFTDQCTVEVTKEILMFNLQLSIVGQGTITTSPNETVFEEGTLVTLTATPKEGYVFDGWEGAVVSSEAVITVTMDTHQSITARFSGGTDPGYGDAKVINLPFSFDGEGEKVWETTDEIDYINSWNLVQLEINGQDYTNKWSNRFPEKVDGKYLIKYKGNYPWSHVELKAKNTLKSARIGLAKEFKTNTIGTKVVATAEKNFLSVRGNKIFDASGKEVFLRGVNWFGFETQMGYFHGIWSRDMKSVLQQVKDLGFNCIRIPWCNAILTQKITAEINSYGSDPYTGVSPMNQVVSTLETSLEILDVAIQWCQDNNMKVILDNHSREPDGYMAEQLWYTNKVSHEQWIEDWKFMTARYKEYDAVIAMDINNEPHGPYGGGSRWGTGNPANDWRLAAQECGNAILEVNPDVLIMVEGTEEFRETSYWWGGNLQGARDYPVVLSNPEKLVYSPHEYGPTVHMQDWFKTADFPDNLNAIWETNFNYLHTNETSPLFFGEFGIRDAGGKDEVWFDKLVSYMGEKGHHWTFWCLNPNSGDTGGLLDYSWSNVVEWKMEKLRPYLADEIPNGSVSSTPPEDINVESISLDQTSIQLSEGETQTLVATVLPTNATNRSVGYSTSDANVAIVSDQGLVTAVGLGDATITASSDDGGFTAVCLVEVAEEGGSNPPSGDINVESISLDQTSIQLSEGETQTLVTTVLPINATNRSVRYITSNANVATVSDQGLLTAVGLGDATITVTSNDGGFTATCLVAVAEQGGTNPPSGGITVQLPFEYGGSGTLQWVVSEDIEHVNSWSTSSITINGTDYTNVWSNVMPAKIDGKYYISYNASNAWSHFEIKGFGGTKSLSFDATSDTPAPQVQVYPNPVKDFLMLKSNVEMVSCSLYSTQGTMISQIQLGGSTFERVDLQEFSNGVYLVKVNFEKGDSQMFKIVVE